MTFLTPLAGLAVLAALVPLGAFVMGRGRVATVRRRLGLPAPARASVARQAAGIAAIAVLGLAATQPALSSTLTARTRTNAAVLFVLDTSRSMAASATPSSSTRLERAVAAAALLRADIPTVPAGIATFTDRVLPALLPVTDVATFDRVLTQTVAIENPPPLYTMGVVATDFDSLEGIGSGDYFAPGVSRRVVVLLTDGESVSFNGGEIAAQLPPAFGWRFLAIRFWAADEGVYAANGRREPGYHPNPAGKVLLARLAGALGGRSYEEADLAAAASYLRRVVGSGRTVTIRHEAGVNTLAPYLAGVALLLLALALAPVPARWRSRSARPLARSAAGPRNAPAAGGPTDP